jgi:hypothetical protein
MAPRTGIGRIIAHGLLETGELLRPLPRVAGPPVGEGLQHAFVGGQGLGRAAVETLQDRLADGAIGCCEIARYPTRDVLLDRNRACGAEVAIVGSGPQELAGSRVDQPRGDPQARGVAAQAALNQVIDLHATPNFGGIARERLGEAGLAREHPEIGEQQQIGDQLLGQAVGQDLAGAALGQNLEGHHGKCRTPLRAAGLTWLGDRRRCPVDQDPRVDADPEQQDQD